MIHQGRAARSKARNVLDNDRTREQVVDQVEKPIKVRRAGGAEPTRPVGCHCAAFVNG